MPLILDSHTIVNIPQGETGRSAHTQSQGFSKSMSNLETLMMQQEGNSKKSLYNHEKDNQENHRVFNRTNSSYCIGDDDRRSGDNENAARLHIWIIGSPLHLL